MKNLLIVCAVALVLALSAYALIVVPGTLTGSKLRVNSTADTLTTSWVAMNDFTHPERWPLYKSLVFTCAVPTSDTTVDLSGVTGAKAYDTGSVRLRAVIGDAITTVYTSSKATLPNTFTVALSDTGALNILFNADAIYFDVMTVDSAGNGSGDSLSHSYTINYRLISNKEF